MFHYQTFTINDDDDIDSMSITDINAQVTFSCSYNTNNNLLLPPMLKQPFHHHKFTKHNIMTTILKATMKAHLLTHQSHTCPEIIVTSSILNPPNLMHTLTHTHNCLMDRQTTV